MRLTSTVSTEHSGLGSNENEGSNLVSSQGYSFLLKSFSEYMQPIQSLIGKAVSTLSQTDPQIDLYQVHSLGQFKIFIV